MKNNFITYETYMKMGRGWLTGLLFFLPFQANIVRIINSWCAELGTIINRLDEITISVFILLAIIESVRKRALTSSIYLFLIFPTMLVILTSLVSGIKNDNSLFITALGTFDYVKVFLIVYIYAAFFKEVGNLRKIINFLVIIAVVLGVIAAVQEIWALTCVYILDKDKTDAGIYIFRTWVRPELTERYWRFGMYRAPSLFNHSTFLGFYCLFVFIIYLYVVRKAKYSVVIPLLAGITMSLSRVVFIGFVIMAGIRMLSGKKRIMIILVPIAAGLIFMSFLSDFNIPKLLNIVHLNKVTINNVNPSDESSISFRKYTKDKSLEVWKDKPMLGAGPGMFGGVISILYNSYLYKEYNFQSNWLFRQSRGIDQFWPRVLAEIGIIGCTIYSTYFIMLSIIFSVIKKQTGSQEIRSLFRGLSVFIIMIFVWTLGSGMNSPVIFIFFALAGIGMSITLENSGNSVCALNSKCIVKKL